MYRINFFYLKYFLFYKQIGLTAPIPNFGIKIFHQKRRMKIDFFLITLRTSVYNTFGSKSER